MEQIQEQAQPAQEQQAQPIQATSDFNEPAFLTKEQKAELSHKEIAQRIRFKLAKEFPCCKFSITIENYSGGGSIHISLMSCKGTKIIRDFNEISETALFRYDQRQYSAEQIKEMQSKKYHQLNDHAFYDTWDIDDWNNGVFLTKEGHNILKRVVEIAEFYNWDNSDSQTDYFDVHFYLHLSLGKWDKDFMQL